MPARGRSRAASSPSGMSDPAASQRRQDVHPQRQVAQRDGLAPPGQESSGLGSRLDAARRPRPRRRAGPRCRFPRRPTPRLAQASAGTPPARPRTRSAQWRRPRSGRQFAASVTRGPRSMRSSTKHPPQARKVRAGVRRFHQRYPGEGREDRVGDSVVREDEPTLHTELAASRFQPVERLDQELAQSGPRGTGRPARPGLLRPALP